MTKTKPTHNNPSFKALSSAALLSAGFLMLSGCATKPSTTSANRVYRGPVPTYYTVRSGDTVSKIANRYGLNWRDVARINYLDSNYTIYVNQRLKLKGSAVSTRSTNYSTSTGNWQSRNLNTGSVGNLDASRINQPAPRPVTKPVTRLPATSAAAATQGWFRPARGQIFQKFSPAAGVKGIRFEGGLGDPVFASKAGEVIYASNGLKEYGNLVLIRHTDGYISAYAHNNTMLVKEGERVATGKKIATIGSTGTTRNMLEFQIRKDGKPIDPLSVMNP